MAQDDGDEVVKVTSDENDVVDELNGRNTTGGVDG